MICKKPLMDIQTELRKLKISVIIPVYNDRENLAICLDAIKRQTLPSKDFEVIVVNNGTAESLTQSEEWPSNVVLCHEPIPGSYAARNRGATAGRGEVLAFTDADCIPEPGWLQHALECFSETGCDMIGGLIELFKKEQGSNLTYIYEKNHLFKQKANVEQGVSVTANFFIKRAAFEETGGFNAEIKSMGDMEFTGRCTESGLKLVYSEMAKVRHPARVSISDVLKRRRRIVCWKTIHGGLDGKGKRIRLLRLAIIRALFDFRSFIRKKPKKGNVADTLRFQWMIAIVATYEFYVRLKISIGAMDPRDVRE